MLLSSRKNRCGFGLVSFISAMWYHCLMKEIMPTGSTSEEPEEQKKLEERKALEGQRRREEQEEDDQYEQYMKDHPDRIIAPEDLREGGPEIAAFEEMLVSFESAHSIAELNLIVGLTPQEALNHPVREPARVALFPIC